MTIPPKATELRHVVAAVSAALAHPPSDDNVAAIFERQVQQLLSMRAVRLREIPSRYHARLVTPTRTAESIVVGVPTSDPSVQAVLEAKFERGRRLDVLRTGRTDDEQTDDQRRAEPDAEVSVHGHILLSGNERRRENRRGRKPTKRRTGRR